MSRFWFWCCVLACWTVEARADVPMPAVGVTNAIPMEALMLDLTCVLPINGPAVERGVLMARLYEYDPRKVDGEAKEICRVAVSGISHQMGEETVLRFPCRGGTPVRKAYYITAVVYPEGVPADNAGLYFIDGFQRVLSTGNREVLSVTLAPVDTGDAGPSN